MERYAEQLNAIPRGIGAQTVSPTEYGVQTAIKQLHEAAHEAYRLSCSLKESIGVGDPPSESGKQPSAPTLAATIGQAVEMIEAANRNQRRVFEHLGS